MSTNQRETEFMPPPEEYQRILLSQNEIKLLIIGKDSFPTEASGIPFCKGTWNEQMADNCSGKHVLQSLGVNVSISHNEFQTPKELFFHLARNKIGMLNLCYSFLNRAVCKYDMEILQISHRINFPLIQMAETTILCGEASKLSWLMSIDGGAFKEVIHPDIQNRNNPKRAQLWHQWWSPDRLNNRLNIMAGLQ